MGVASAEWVTRSSCIRGGAGSTLNEICDLFDFFFEKYFWILLIMEKCY